MTGGQGNAYIIHQIQKVLSDLSNDEYIHPIPVFHGGTIGEHIRHILEFYTCLFDGVTSKYVDYGSRVRNSTLANDRNTALDILEYLRQEVLLLNEDISLDVKNEYDSQDFMSSYSRSSLGRELQYAFDHAIHHLALIRIALETELPHIQFDSALGIAPSTLHFREKHSATKVNFRS